jgi:pantoate--beta-alanine ligase
MSPADRPGGRTAPATAPADPATPADSTATAAPAPGADGTRNRTPHTATPGTDEAPAPAPHEAPAPGRPSVTGAPTPEAAPAAGPATAVPFALLPTVPHLRDFLGHWTTPGSTAAVMTMGALHEGHAALVRAARERVGPRGTVIVTVFVNPLQFGAGEDLDRYPRTLDADIATARAAGADAVFAPSAAAMYPEGEPQVRIAAGPMGGRLEGAFRPGHFDGMLTVVAKLLHLVRPDLAFFGEKDAQQLALIRRMVRDLNLPAEIVGVATVREDDGLALSSRNRYLSPAERTTALTLSRALFAARDRLAAQQALLARAEAAGPPAGTGRERAEALAAMGEVRAAADAAVVAQAGAAATGPGTGMGADAVRGAAHAVLDEAAHATPPLTLDYLALVDPVTFAEVPDGHRGEAILAVAAKVGTTRLIDNIPLSFGAPS